MRPLVQLLRISLVCCTAVLGACATQEPAAPEQQRLPSDFEDVSVELGRFAGGYLRNGVFLPATAIYQVAPGVNRQEVQRLLGMPTESPSPDWWFYTINLPLEGLDDYLVCQYRLAFSGDVVQEAVWRRPQCKVLHDNMLTRAFAVDTSSQPQTQAQVITLSSDILFDFNSATLSEKGRLELSDVAQIVQRDLDMASIDIVGHADRTGRAAYNDTLSLRRARAVADFLASAGISKDIITATGNGSRDPVVTCEGTEVTDELKRCLQPNRRVVITINGRR